MRRTTRAVIAATSVLAVIAIAVPAGARVPKTWVVRPNESVQAAVNAAKPGDAIVLLPGTYRQSVTIKKDDITLRGAGGFGGGTVLRPPTNLGGPCKKLSGGSGVCVLGSFDGGGQLTGRISDVVVSGIQFLGWPSSGVFAYGTQDLLLDGNTAYNIGEYGLASFDGLGAVIRNNRTGHAGEAGIYLGDSAGADAKISHNDSWDSTFGIFVRHASGVTVQQNHVFDNCEGIMVLDDGRGGVSDITVKFNAATSNTKTCPASDEAPPLAGGGILLLGASDSNVTQNIVRNNEGTEINSGGILLLSAEDLTGGQAPSDTVVTDNLVFGNGPYDVFTDGSGSGNRLTGNLCETSAPADFCV
jgi:nitrous oxidase accessory protein NosD